MIDIFCQRCGAKLGWRYQNAQGVVIKCPCGTKHYVASEKSVDTQSLESPNKPS